MQDSAKQDFHGRSLRKAFAIAVAFGTWFMAMPLRAEIEVSAASEMGTYAKGQTNTLRFDVSLRSRQTENSDIENADIIEFKFPPTIRASALRYESGIPGCPETPMITVGMDSSTISLSNVVHPSGCGFFVASSDGTAHIFSVDIQIPASYVGALPIQVVAKGATGCCDGGQHESVANLSLEDDASPARWTIEPELVPALPDGWSSDSLGGMNWVTTASSIQDAQIHLALPPSRSDNALLSPRILIAPDGGELQFRHTLAANPGHDGAVLEISINDSPFEDFVSAGGTFRAGGYAASIGSSSLCSAAGTNPLEGRSGWESASDERVAASFPPAAAGLSVQLRWRLGTDCDDEVPRAGGWIVDDIAVVGATAKAAVSPSALELAILPGTIRQQRLTIENTGGGALNYSFFTAETDCGHAGNIAWLTPPLPGSVRGGSLVDAQMEINADKVEASGLSSALVCMLTDNAISSIPVSVKVTPSACAEAPIFADGFDAQEKKSCMQSYRIYTNRDAFKRDIAPGYFDNPFTLARPGEFLSADFGNATYHYLMTAQADAEVSGVKIETGAGGVTTISPLDQPTVSFSGSLPDAVGGYFRSAVFQTFFHSHLEPESRIVVTLDGDLEQTINAPAADGFRGFISDMPIHGLSLRTLDLTADGDLPWALIDELIVGRAR